MKKPKTYSITEAASIASITPAAILYRLRKASVKLEKGLRTSPHGNTPWALTSEQFKRITDGWRDGRTS